MKIKKLLVILIGIIFLTGCTNILDYSCDDLALMLGKNVKNSNVYRNGYSFYVPNGLKITDASFNYAIIASSKYNYYVYFDLIAYSENKELVYEINPNIYYSKKINNNNILGYIEIKLLENNQYLIEIMYNYAKIEVMVDESQINKALINSINILNSIKYDKTVIDNLLKDDNLDFTEETFNMFKKVKKNTNILNYSENNNEEITENEIEVKDTDFLN